MAEHVGVIVGDSPVILSVPHGGYEMPTEIPDRAGEDVVVENDVFSQELGLLIAAKFEELTGRRMHVVINKLHRSKLDMNRNLQKAALGNVIAGATWQFYQDAINNAKDKIRETYGRGFFIDLHGQDHAEEWIELGYGLSLKDLENVDETVLRRSTIGGLGNVSILTFGALLEAHGYKSVPSPQYPHPAGGSYFNGGFLVRTHGSGHIDGIQFELPLYVRTPNSHERDRFVEIFCKIIVDFVVEHYKMTVH